MSSEPKQKKIPLKEAKQAPPEEPVNVAPFQSVDLKKALTSPPPEPTTKAPFSQTKTRSKDPKQSAETEGKQ